MKYLGYNIHVSHTAVERTVRINTIFMARLNPSWPSRRLPQQREFYLLLIISVFVLSTKTFVSSAFTDQSGQLS